MIINQRRTFASPSGRYSVTSSPNGVYIENVLFRTQKREDAETETETENETTVAVAAWREVKSAVARALVAFACVQNTEWCVGGVHYASPLLINCDTGAIYEGPDAAEGFLWRAAKMSRDGARLMVSGMFWGLPAESQLLDLTALQSSGRLQFLRTGTLADFRAFDGVWFRAIETVCEDEEDDGVSYGRI